MQLTMQENTELRTRIFDTDEEYSTLHVCPTHFVNGKLQTEFSSGHCHCLVTSVCAMMKSAFFIALTLTRCPVLLT